MYKGLIQDYQLLVHQEGDQSRLLFSALVPLSMYTLEIVGRGNQPQGWKCPVLPTLSIT